MAKHLFHIIVIGSQIIGKSLVKAIKEEIHLSQEAAKYLQQQNANIKQIKAGLLSLKEAKEILDIGNKFNKQELEDKYKFLFEANSDRKGGNLYLRSKIVRAKERLDYELANSANSKENEKK